jgi:polar amino acid transport system substrate-binding protein
MKICAFSVFILLSLLGFSQTTQLGLAYDIMPPFTNKIGERAIASEIVKTALNRNTIAVKERVLDFNTLIKGLEAGRLEGSPAIRKNEGLEQFLLYSEPILFNQLVLIGKKGSDVNLTDISELKGKRVALPEYYGIGKDRFESEGVLLSYGKSDQANLLNLLEGKVDYILVDDLLAAYLRTYQAGDASKYIEMGSTPLINQPLYFALNRNIPDAQDIIDRFDATIAQMKADGTYNRILELKWLQTDVDGDGKLELIPGPQAGRVMDSPYSLEGQKSDSTQIYYHGKIMNWEELPDEVKRTGINSEEVKDITFLRFGL